MKLPISILAVLILVSSASAQAPRLIQTSSGNPNDTTCPFFQNVASGDVLIFSSAWSGGTAPVITDTLGNTFTAVAGFPTTTNSVTLGIWVATSSSSGADTVTIALTGGSARRSICAEYRNITATVDVASAGSYSGTPNPIVSGSATTNFNGDLLYAIAAGDHNGLMNPIAPFVGINYANGFGSIAGEFELAGVAGSYSASFANPSVSGQNVSAPIGLVAFKAVSSGITITSGSTAPDGALSQAYSYTLNAVGGAGAYTWSITAGTLQTGLSLNSSSGLISGTPTGSSLNSITFQVTDGTLTTTKTISLKIAGLLNTITHVQDSGSSENGVFPGSVTAGDLLLAASQAAPGTNSGAACSDTLGTDYQFVSAGLMSNGSVGIPVMVYIYTGVAPSSGTDTVTCDGNTVASEFSNAAGFVDNFNLTASSGGSTYTSSSLATLGPNELLFSMASAFTGTATITVNAPYTHVPRTHNFGSSDYDIVTTVTGYTVSYAASGNTDGQWAIVLAGFRPTGGAVRPRVPIHSQVY